MQHLAILLPIALLQILLQLPLTHSLPSSRHTRHRLQSNESIIRHLQTQYDRGIMQPQFTIVGENSETHQEYEFNVIQAHSAVTKETTYSVHGGEISPVEGAVYDLKFLVSDPSRDADGDAATSSGSADTGAFTFIAVDETSEQVQGVSQTTGFEPVNIAQVASNTVTVSETTSFTPPQWSCFVNDTFDKNENDDFPQNIGVVHEVGEVDGIGGARHLLSQDDHDEHGHNHRHDHAHTLLRNFKGDYSSLLNSIDQHLDMQQARDRNRNRKRKLYATDNFPALWSYEVEMYIEIDDIFVSNHGGNLTAAHQYVNTIITAASSVFEREIDTHLHVAHIAVTNLYQNQATISDAITLMRNTYGGSQWHFQGAEIDIHHAMLGQQLYGGIAYVGTTCNSNYGFGLSTGMMGTFQGLSAPTLWDLIVVAHELGHNLGSMHTHDTAYNPLVDSCGNSCPAGLPLQSSATIMSYCHICPGYLSNTAYTFGGYWDEGFRQELSSWANNPILQGTISTDPRRVSKTMWDHVASLGSCVDPGANVPKVVCISDLDCNDGLPCTDDKCNTETSQCENTFNPFCCGNSVCETGEESCAEDCGPFSLETPPCSSCFVPFGMMFDITALTDIKVTEIRAILSAGVADVTVYTAGGSFQGQHTDPDAWIIIASGPVSLSGYTWIKLTVDVDIDAGKTRSFYIASTGRILSGNHFFDPLAEDENVQFRSPGRAFAAPEPFGSSNYLGYSFNGDITYSIKSATNAAQAVDIPETIGGIYTRIGATGIGCPSSTVDGDYWDMVQYLNTPSLEHCAQVCAFLKRPSFVGFMRNAASSCHCFFKDGETPTIAEALEVDSVRFSLIQTTEHASKGPIVFLSNNPSYCSEQTSYSYDGLDQTAEFGAYSLSDYEGGYVMFGETCIASTSASGESVECSASWKNYNLDDEHDKYSATLKSSIIEGACENLNEFTKTPASSNPSKNGTTNFKSTISITGAEKGATTVTKKLCARADLVDDIQGSSVIANLTEITVTFTYAQDGTFAVSDVGTAPFTAVEATASDTRLASLTAEQGACGAPASMELSVGDELIICVKSSDADIKVTQILNVEVTLVNSQDAEVGSRTIVDAVGKNNFVTSVVQTDNNIELSSLIVPFYADALGGAAGTLNVEGTGIVEYINRRLGDGRMVQNVKTIEDSSFSIKIPLGESKMPEIAKAYGGSGTNFPTGLFAVVVASMFVTFGMS